MARDNITVPFGYKEPAVKVKGTLIMLDSFDDWEEPQLSKLFGLAEERAFAKVVFAPQHEETLRRMKYPCDIPFYKRIKNLNQIIELLQPHTDYVIDEWEGKRKKYTPIDTLLRFLVDKYPGPYFVYMNDWYANVFANTVEFEAWIKRLRFFIDPRFRSPLHPKILNAAGRWDELKLFE
ncbi:hypothetical protein E0485_01260 [Paenibacillus albiflavus]|uniref:Uncharacterized protein n=1 Tax=Paenibacillus albiflavus TaxID=2545760 RepID=A0A4R4EMZ0_9BACL|nr:hypothetical protein [Paenibacillus albiflavus]TCZ80943.1 hypothetical protein E0485_01260 [Paenibacillus albiflavus]